MFEVGEYGVMEGLLHAVIFLPILGAVLIMLLPGQRPSAPRWVAGTVTAVVLLLSLVLFVAFPRGEPGFQFVTKVPWIPQIGAQYFVGVDGISLPLVVLNALLTFLAVLVSWRLDLRPKEYFSLVLVLETAVMGVFTSLDLFLFLLFWELELAPMYLLIGIWGGPRREYAAFKFLLYTVFGSAFMIVGVLGLFFLTGARTFDLMALREAAGLLPLATQVFLFAMLFIGFAVKLPVFPFHTWLPDAHVEAPTAMSVLLAGVLLKMGGYGMLRFAVDLLPQAALQVAWLLAILAVINVLYGALVALAQSDLKKLVANSSVSHMGYVLLGIAAMTLVGFQGAVILMVAHGLITGLMFMMVGLVYDRAHTREIPELGGLAARMPFIATVFVMAGLASLGLPGMAGFVAEFAVFIGSFPVWSVHTALAVFGVVLTAGYILWMLQRVFFGPLNSKWEGLGDATRREVFYTATLVAVIVLVGVYPNVVAEMIGQSTGAMFERVQASAAALAALPSSW